MILTRQAVLLSFASVLLIAVAGSAGVVSETLFVIEAREVGSNLTGEYAVSLSEENRQFGDTLDWTLAEPVLLIDANENGQLDMGVDTILENVSVTYIADPVVTLNFVVSSGFATNYTVTSANLGFSPIPNAVGRATAAVTVSDFNGNGASLTGLHPGGRAYQAFYNDPLSVPATGTTFASLVSGISSSTRYSSSTVSESFPVSSTTYSSTNQAAVPLGAVTDMSAEFRFRTSAGDSASGTSTFIINVPEPTSICLALVGLMGLAFGRVRARRLGVC